MIASTTAHERSLIATILDHAASYQWLASSVGYMQCWIDLTTAVMVWHPSILRAADVCDVIDSPVPLLYKVVVGEAVCQKHTRCLPGTGRVYRRMTTSADKVVHINTISLADGGLVEYAEGASFFVNAVDITQFLAKDGTVLIAEQVSKGERLQNSMFIEDGKKFIAPELWTPAKEVVRDICVKSLRKWFVRV